jgi:hypothetical protein
VALNTLYIVWLEKHLPQVLILAYEDHCRTNAPVKKIYASQHVKTIIENIILAQGMDKE